MVILRRQYELPHRAIETTAMTRYKELISRITEMAIPYKDRFFAVFSLEFAAAMAAALPATTWF